MTPIDRYISESSFHVRYAETDKMGIVHHAAYIIWFEEGRSEFIRQRGGSYADIEKTGYFLAANELNARYIKAAVYDQLIRVRCWVDSYKSRVMVFACEIDDASTGELLFMATIKLICLNAEGQVTRIPKEWAKWMEA